MMLSTKARRVSVGARAGNARRSALRRGCGERFRTWAGKAWPAARGRGPGEPGTHARGAGKPTPGNSVPKDVLPTPEDAEAPSPGPARAAGLGPGRRVPQDSEGRCGSGNADAMGLPCSGEPGRLGLQCRGTHFGRGRGRTPEGRSARPEGREHARGSGWELPRRPGEGRRPEVRLRERPAPLSVRDAAVENSAATGPKAVRRKIPPCSVSRPRRPRETTRTSSVQSRPRATGAVFQGADVREPAFAAGLGPANGLAAGLGDRRCGSGNAYALGLPCSGEPERLARWFGGKARRNPERIPEGLETPGPSQQLRRTAARGRPGRSPNRHQKRRSSIPCPGTFRKRNTLP